MCSRCYLRIRRTHEFPWEVGRKHSDYVRYIYEDRPDHDHDVTEVGFYEQPTLPGRCPKDYPPPKTGAANELRGSRHCACCGEFDAERDQPTRSTREAVDVAANISQTLEEYEISHDWVLLLELTKRLKRSPVTSGDDHATFERAVAKAIERVR
ncbi:hypothetical protein [Natronorarus salvus]|uniref:hypothetical protein n=1 Tax=Natronorarus salvus TaxID=3117733 RepID=UPI002F268D69